MDAFPPEPFADPALAAAERRAEAARQRMLDALQATGAARDDIGRMAEEFGWLRSLIAKAEETAGKSRDEAAWLRRALEEQQTQALARVQESAWLRGCLADAEARIAAAEARRADAESRVAASALATAGALREWAAAQTRTHDAETALQAMQQSTSWRVTAPLRRLHGAPPLLPQPPTATAVGNAAAALAAWDPPAPCPQADPIRQEAPKALEAAEPPPPVAPFLPSPQRHEGQQLRKPVPAEPQPGPLPENGGIVRRLVATVHQFHAGSAAGDAITNAMLLIRGQLRAAGFRSEIYVAHLGPGLEESGIRLWDAMPRHDGYILLYHHSMGFPGFPGLMALPARKVLIYHNITPPELLGVPRIRSLAALGRDQLAVLPGAVEFALADSDHNAVELHRLGFAAVRTCPLLFDVETLIHRASGKQPSRPCFTVLFVGRVSPSKAQDELVDAFAAFRRRFGRPCRLVLVGALEADEHRFIAAIRARAAFHGLEDDVLLTGLVSEAELREWFQQADLYVSLSRHEGFAVPLVEAMAHGVPVLAWATGAVPFTLGEGGALLTDRAPASVADRMIAVASAGPDRAAQAAALQRWSLPRHLPVLMTALATAGAVPPDAAMARAVSGSLNVTLSGHVAKTYSLAAINRGLARTLELHRPGRVRLRPVEGAPTTDLSEVPEGDRAFVATLAARPDPDTGPELTISNHYPLHRPAKPGDLNAALFFWEESLVPPQTVAELNAGFDAVFAPAASVARTLVDSGVAIPVINIGAAPDLSALAALDPARPRPGPFTFLHVSSCFPRKGLDTLLAAWAPAFPGRSDVRLVIKTFPNPHNDAAAQVARLRTDHPDAAPVELIDAELDAEAMLALYRDAHAAVLPSRGEGFNLPAAEAMAAGLPLVVTDAGGHRDFCGPETARLVRSRPEPSRSHLAPGHSLWSEPDAADLAAALQSTVANPADVIAARAAILRHVDGAAFAGRLGRVAGRLLVAAPPPPVRTAWVTSWYVRCGIAEYARTLIDALPGDCLAKPVIVPDARSGGDWAVADPRSASPLLAALQRADADVTVIQHQPGLLPWPVLAELLDGMAAAGLPAIVTLHNTAHLLDIDPGERADTLRALAGAARVLVHTLADVVRLTTLGLPATLLPHPALEPARVPVLATGAAPVIGCTGFFLPDKGIDTLIAAAARLRARWPGLRLRLVNAEYDDPASAAAIAACRALAAELGVPVEWHTAFVTPAAQRALLAGCDMIVLPYQRSKEGSSAALRSALATGLPVAVTPLPLFDEAADAVARLPGLDPGAIALGIGRLLAEPDRRAAVVHEAHDWAAARALPDVARRLHGMLLGLAAQSRAGQRHDGAPWVG